MISGFDMGFGLFEIMFAIIFIIIVGTFIVAAVRGISTWNKNNHSPRLTVSAVIVAKRTDVSYHHHSNGEYGMHATSSTTYYVTFQVESGDRIELEVSGTEYGMLVEGDKGYLSFQGTRYLSFEINHQKDN
ncbi:MAG TPA: DUF2500 domain-containing protein [Candidatus Mediterraneibacter surreyensis]|mgnify:FL=1|nr:DUF2500 domain-containing protein [Candidatus Mediterraneibacter surreyensis]